MENQNQSSSVDDHHQYNSPQSQPNNTPPSPNKILPKKRNYSVSKSSKETPTNLYTSNRVKESSVSPTQHESSEVQEIDQSVEIGSESKTSGNEAGEDSEERARKKRRINRQACVYCSRLHKKCDGMRPEACTRCSHKGLKCLYAQRAKRGPKSKRGKDMEGEAGIEQEKNEINVNQVGGSSSAGSGNENEPVSNSPHQLPVVKQEHMNNMSAMYGNIFSKIGLLPLNPSTLNGAVSHSQAPNTYSMRNFVEGSSSGAPTTNRGGTENGNKQPVNNMVHPPYYPQGGFVPNIQPFPTNMNGILNYATSNQFRGNPFGHIPGSFNFGQSRAAVPNNSTRDTLLKNIKTLQDEYKEQQKNRLNVLVCATGSVATIKINEVVSCLKGMEQKEQDTSDQKIKFNIKVLLSSSSEHFVSKENVQSKSEVVCFNDEDEWTSWNKRDDPVLHIELRKWADVLVICPLSANTLSKISNGMCDNLITCVCRAWDFNKLFIVAPAMNTLMWNHPFTQKQLDILKNELKVKVIEPISKKLMCNDIGKGAMETPKKIAQFVLNESIKHYKDKFISEEQ